MADHRVFRLSVLGFILLALLLATAVPLAAQTGTVEVRTHGVDYSAFPGVCVRVAPVTNDGALISGLAADAFQIYENGAPRPVLTVAQDYVGAQIAVVFDASGSFKKPGVTSPQKRRVDEAVEALDDLLLTDKWLQRGLKRDQVMLLAPTGTDSFTIAQPWTNDYNLVHNQAVPLSPVNADTPLYKMLVEAIARMKDLADYEGRAKFIVIFSDGVDRTSAQEGTDVIKNADELGVKVLSVLIGPAGGSPAKTLRRLAEETGGETRGDWAYTAYQGPDSLIRLFQAIRSQADQYQICYRSRIKSSSPVNLEVGVMSGGREFRSKPVSLTIPVKEAAVRVTVPEDGAVVDRVASRHDQDPATIEPRAQPVTVEVGWPDGFGRNIDRVLYEVDGAVVADLLPDEAFIWDFSQLPAGIHALRAIVRDEMGIESRSDPVKVTINITIPTPPPPTPTPVPTPRPFVDQVLAFPKEQPVLVIVMAITLLAAVFAVYVLIRLLRSRPRNLQEARTSVAVAVREATEIFRPKQPLKQPGGAWLVPLDSAGIRGEPIPIQSQSVNVGRVPAKGADIVFPDPSVSGLHARIAVEPGRGFMLYDEGSTNGTAVNGEAVLHEPHLLQTGDVIEFGRVRVIFQIGGTAAQPVGGRQREEDERTEIFQGRR